MSYPCSVCGGNHWTQKCNSGLHGALLDLIRSVVHEEQMKEGDSYSGPDATFENEIQRVHAEICHIVKAEVSKALKKNNENPEV